MDREQAERLAWLENSDEARHTKMQPGRWRRHRRKKWLLAEERRAEQSEPDPKREKERENLREYE